MHHGVSWLNGIVYDEKYLYFLKESNKLTVGGVLVWFLFGFLFV